MMDFKYIGEELDLFADVHNWKAYWASHVRPYLSGDVLEVGAGVGNNTALMMNGHKGSWLCLEPDARLLARLQQQLPQCAVQQGTVESLLTQERKFDTLVYIDVLEHIEDDRAELNRAAKILRPDGQVIVLSPAHQKLFTPFDAAIGHYRRYNRKMIQALAPDGLQLELNRYLDCVGMLASGANLLFLKQSQPKKEQLQLWDRWMVPVSRALDPLFGYSVGKSILAVWQKG